MIDLEKIITNYVYIPYKTGYLNLKFNCLPNNNSVIILLPGQSLPAEMFFGLPLYSDNSSITDKIVRAGIDVIYLDPINYGRSRGIIYELYTRDIMSEQLLLAAEYIKNKYSKIILHGFSTTTHVPLISATKIKVAGIVLQSPVMLKPIPYEYTNYILNRNNNEVILNTDIYALKNQRFKNISDRLIGKYNRADNWEEVFLKHLQTFAEFKEFGKWFGSKDMPYDIKLYPSANNNQGWDVSAINCPIVSIRGQYDYECKDLYRQLSLQLNKKLILQSVVPNTTHFGMWDKDYEVWADYFINCINTIIENAV